MSLGQFSTIFKEACRRAGQEVTDRDIMIIWIKSHTSSKFAAACAKMVKQFCTPHPDSELKFTSV